jgi:hypothetical protein
MTPGPVAAHVPDDRKEAFVNVVSFVAREAFVNVVSFVAKEAFVAIVDDRKHWGRFVVASG